MEGVGRNILLFVCVGLVAWDQPIFGAEHNVLVFGGNGFIGSSVVARLVEDGHKVTMVSRGNWYWDSEKRTKEVSDKFIKCDRSQKIESCSELKDFLEGTEHFDAVYDFSAQNGKDVNDTIPYLSGKVGLYVFISTGSIYDVCNKEHEESSKETDAVRPESMNEREMLNHHHRVGHEKLEAEEAIMAQRLTPGGFPFVILRLPDVFGPRDTTYRFAIYHLWTKLTSQFKDKPVMLPDFLRDYKMSFVYSEDVARVAVDLLTFGPQIRDQAINLAYPEHFNMREFVEEIQEALALTRGDNQQFWPKDYQHNFYLYPTIRRGPIDVAKAQSLLSWQPTPFTEAIKSTVDFYEMVMSSEKYDTQRNEIIQIVAHQVYPDNRDDFYANLEKIYDIQLPHFRPKDEL